MNSDDKCIAHSSIVPRIMIIILFAQGFLGASGVLLGAAIFNPIATEGPGMMESPFSSLGAIVKSVPSSSGGAAVKKSAAAVVAPAKKVTAAPKSLQEQGYDFDESKAAKKEVRVS